MKKFLIGFAVVGMLTISMGRAQPPAPTQLDQQQKSLEAEILSIEKRAADLQAKSESLMADFGRLNEKASRVAQRDNELKIQEQQIEREASSLQSRDQKLKESHSRLEAADKKLQVEVAQIKSAQQMVKQSASSIESERRHLDNTNKYEVDRFNKKVVEHNQKLRELEQQVTAYEDKAKQLDKQFQEHDREVDAINQVPRIAGQTKGIEPGQCEKPC